MLSHVTVGSADLPRAIAFYDALLLPLGYVRHETDLDHGMVGYCIEPTRTPQFYVMRPVDGLAASVGNGVTVAFEAGNRAAVDAFHAAALARGAPDLGAPGLRPHYHPDFYGAYARDPDGNKIACVCHSPFPAAAG